VSAAGVQRIVCLSGGVGGARLCHGLSRALPAGQLTFVVNTGDDFTHWGLSISPDLDTVMYTLADLAQVERGWGLSGDTFSALEMVGRYGGEAWFQLGDRDLATHVLRSQWLRDGCTLTEVTRRLSTALAIASPVLPMSDAPCPTLIDTPGGTLSFQDWLVAQRGAPEVLRVRTGSDASATPEVLTALEAATCVIIGPSNPYVSIDPILALPGVRERVARLPCIAVSPIVHGAAVKGPLAGMLRTLGKTAPTPAAIVRHYGGLLAALVVERGDEASARDGEHAVRVHDASTLMRTRAQSLELAREVLRVAESP
jgi:LPPG:FO 2-phospho-L-lactate transferase